MTVDHRAHTYARTGLNHKETEYRDVVHRVVVRGHEPSVHVSAGRSVQLQHDVRGAARPALTTRARWTRSRPAHENKRDSGSPEPLFSCPRPTARVAEGVGFEPTMGYEPIAVFKTAALGHYASPPVSAEVYPLRCTSPDRATGWWRRAS